MADVRWLTVRDVAEILRVHEETVRRWIRRGDLMALDLGGPRAGYRIRPSELDRFINSNYNRDTAVMASEQTENAS